MIQEFGAGRTTPMKQASDPESQHSPRIWLITAGVHAEHLQTPMVPARAPVWGLGRTLAAEHPEFACTCIDLGNADEVEVEALCREIISGDTERQVLLRGDRRFPSIDDVVIWNRYEH